MSILTYRTQELATARKINNRLASEFIKDMNPVDVDLVWLERSEINELSAINQAGGINSIKADAIEAFISDITSMEIKGRIGTNHAEFYKAALRNVFLCGKHAARKLRGDDGRCDNRVYI